MSTLSGFDLKLVLRQLCGSGDGEAAHLALLEAAGPGGVVPAWRVPSLLAGLRRKAQTVVLALGLAVATPDGLGLEVRAEASPAAIDAALRQQRAEQLERERRRVTQAATGPTPAASPRRSLAGMTEQERTEHRQAQWRAASQRRRGKSPEPSSSPAASDDGVMTRTMTKPVPVITPSDDIGSPVAENSQNSPRILFQEFSKENSENSPEFSPAGATEVAPSAMTASDDAAPPEPPSTPATGEAYDPQVDLPLVVAAWRQQFAGLELLPVRPAADEGAVLRWLRQRELTHVLAGIRRAAREGSWWRMGGPLQRSLDRICNDDFGKLIAEGLDEPASVPPVRCSPAAQRSQAPTTLAGLLPALAPPPPPAPAPSPSPALASDLPPGVPDLIPYTPGTPWERMKTKMGHRFFVVRELGGYLREDLYLARLREASSAAAGPVG